MSARRPVAIETTVEYEYVTDPHLAATVERGWSKLFDLLDRVEVAEKCPPAGAGASSTPPPSSRTPAALTPAAGTAPSKRRRAKAHPSGSSSGLVSAVRRHSCAISPNESAPEVPADTSAAAGVMAAHKPEGAVAAAPSKEQSNAA